MMKEALFFPEVMQSALILISKEEAEGWGWVRWGGGAWRSMG